jgi:hypothetical protein
MKNKPSKIVILKFYIMNILMLNLYIRKVKRAKLFHTSLTREARIYVGNLEVCLKC